MTRNSIRYMTCVAILTAGLTSCVTTNKTAKTAQFAASTYTATVADLDVSDKRVSVTLDPVPAEVRRGGMSNIKKTVEAMALEQNGNADVLVNPEFTYTVEKGFFSKKVTSMTVTGRPAKYKNFHSLNDSVWSDPVFRGVAVRTSSPLRKVKSPFRKSAGFKGGDDGSYSEVGGNYRKGFSWGVDLAAFYDFEEEKAVPSGLLNLGYNITPQLYVGVGSGVEWNTDYNYGFIPVYANVRYYFTKNQNAPFVDGRVGGSTEIEKSRVNGGTYASFALGYSFKTFEISLAYSYQKCEEKDRYSYRTEKKDMNRLGVRLGFRF